MKHDKVYDIKLTFFQGPVRLLFDSYRADHSRAITLVDARDGEPVGIATVCVEGSNLAPNEVLIKSWSENDGMQQELRRLGIIGEVKRAVPTGFVSATVHDLLVNK